MSTREDYIEIKETFEKFVTAWKTADSSLAVECVVPEAACHLSTVQKYPCGSQHGLIGIQDFIKKTVSSDFFYITPCNFVCRIRGDRAQQSAILVCKAGVLEEDEVRVAEFTTLGICGWIRMAEGWRIDDLKMDITGFSGDYTEFTKDWYFEKTDLKYYAGIHLPLCSCEMDSPWVVIPEEDDVKTDEELILEAFSRYAFGIDTLSFINLVYALSDDLVVNMAPWGAMDKREFMQTLKFKRQASLWWSHPVLCDSVTVDGDRAFLKLHRMAGHRQSNMPTVYTKDNYNHCYADARYEIKLIREGGEWKVLRLDYFLGTIDLGEHRR